MYRLRILLVGNLIVSLLVIFGLSCAAQAAYYSPTSSPTPEPQPVDRYEMTLDFDENKLPLLADGKSTIDLRVKIIDNEEKVIKKLDFAVSAKEKSATGKLEVERLRTEYLLTYTAPDITSTEVDATTNTIIAYYRDAENIRRYKEILIPLQNKHFFRISKAGFTEQNTAIDFGGPFAYLKVITISPEGEMIPVQGASLQGSASDEILNTDDHGMIKIPNPQPADDNKIKDFTVILTLEEELSTLQHRIERSYHTLSNGEYAPGNVAIEEFVTDFVNAIANAPDDESSQRMVSGLYRLENIIYLLHRGANTTQFVSQYIGKAARNQLWETVDLYGPITMLTEQIETAVEQHVSSDQTAKAELDMLLQNYPKHFVELASSISGITIALHTPSLDEGIINGFFLKLIDLVATKETSGRAWGETWFEKAVVNYFRERHKQFGDDFLGIVAEMVKKNTFQEHDNTETLAAQREHFRKNTDRIMAEPSALENPIIDAEKFHRYFVTHTDQSVGMLYNSLVNATEKTFDQISTLYIEDDHLAKWLSLYQLVQDETKAAINHAAGFTKADTSLTPLVIPLVFADGQIYKHQHDPTMEKVSKYQLAVNTTIFYERLLQIGNLLLKLDIDSDIVKLTVEDVETKLKTAQTQVNTLAGTIPKQFRSYDGSFQSEAQNIPVPRVIAFVLLMLSGLFYLGYTLFGPASTHGNNPLAPRKQEVEAVDQERADS